VESVFSFADWRLFLWILVETKRMTSIVTTRETTITETIFVRTDDFLTQPNPRSIIFGACGWSYVL